MTQRIEEIDLTFTYDYFPGWGNIPRLLEYLREVGERKLVEGNLFSGEWNSAMKMKKMKMTEEETKV